MHHDSKADMRAAFLGLILGAIVLLGMSFLNRVEMRRDGTLMTLTQRY